MIVKFEWQLRRNAQLIPSRNTFQTRRALFAIVTGLLVLWLLYHHLFQPTWLSTTPVFFVELLTLVESAAVLTIVVVWIIIWWRARRNRLLSNRTQTVAELYALSPKEFERYVAGLFRQKGYRVLIRGRSGDHGVDLELIRQDGKRAIVQCKRYRNAIGPDTIRELFGTMIHERVHHAFLVTTANISESARTWALHKPMTLIDGPTLIQIAQSLGDAGKGSFIV